MIASTTLGKKFNKIVEYVNQDFKDAEVITKNIHGETNTEIINEFKNVADLSRCNQPSYHLAISIEKNAKPLTREQWEDVAKETLTKLGFINKKGKPDRQYYVVRHKDRDHDHIHIIANRVNINGELLNMRHDFLKIQEVMRKKEKELNLQEVKGFKYIEMEKKGRTITTVEKTKDKVKKKLLDNGKPSDKDIIKEKIKEALGYVKANNIHKDKQFDTYRSFLQDNNIVVKDTFEDESKGKLLGMSYMIKDSTAKTKDGKELRLSGSNVGYTLDEIKKHIHIDNEITDKYRNDQAQYIESKEKKEQKKLNTDYDSIESFLEASLAKNMEQPKGNDSEKVRIANEKDIDRIFNEQLLKDKEEIEENRSRIRSNITATFNNNDISKNLENYNYTKDDYSNRNDIDNEWMENERRMIARAERLGREHAERDRLEKEKNSPNYINFNKVPTIER